MNNDPRKEERSISHHHEAGTGYTFTSTYVHLPSGKKLELVRSALPPSPRSSREFTLSSSSPLTGIPTNRQARFTG